MNKKKIVLLSSLLISVTAVSAGLIVNAHSDSILKVAQASDTPRTLTINKDTVKTDKPWLDSYVYTDNGNILPISKVDGTTDEIYSLDDKGDGVGITQSIQAIQSISVTYKLPSTGLKAKSLFLDVGDSTPAYSASYMEEFDLTNASDTKQTQVFNMTNPSQCNYIDFWYASSESGNALIYEIVITYLCA